MCYIGTSYSDSDSLPLDKPGQDPKQEGRRDQKQMKTRQHHTNRQEESSDSESSEDIQLVHRFPHYQQPSQRVVGMNPDAEPFVPDVGRQEREPEQKEVEADSIYIIIRRTSIRGRCSGTTTCSQLPTEGEKPTEDADLQSIGYTVKKD